MEADWQWRKVRGQNWDGKEASQRAKMAWIDQGQEVGGQVGLREILFVGGVELRWPLSKVRRGHRLDDFSFFESTHPLAPFDQRQHASRSRGEHVARPELWRIQVARWTPCGSLLKTTVHSLFTGA